MGGNRPTRPEFPARRLGPILAPTELPGESSNEFLAYFPRRHQLERAQLRELEGQRRYASKDER